MLKSLKYLSLFLSLSLLLASTNAFADVYQRAYNLCLSKTGLGVVEVKGPEQFRPLTPEEQAKKYIPWLKKNSPELASQLDLRTFKQGILEEKYKR